MGEVPEAVLREESPWSPVRVPGTPFGGSSARPRGAEIYLLLSLSAYQVASDSGLHIKALN